MNSGGTASSQRRRLDELLRIPGNRECCDCAAKQPRWASTNLGVFFCLRCAGLHRALGTDVSKVKSTTMDTWEESMVHCCECIGNERGRQLYEHGLPPRVRPSPESDNAAVERFIRDKYERCLYKHPQYDAMLSAFFRGPSQASAPVANVRDRSACDGERTNCVESESDAMPMLWDVTSTQKSQANGHTSRLGLSIDGFFASAPNEQQEPKQQAQGAVQGDVKAEIMSLFSNPPTACQRSGNVYSAWEPRQVQRY